MGKDLVWLDATTEATIGDVGGKAAPLIRLVSGGFRVPRGFCITTHAYRRLVLESGRLSAVLGRLRECDPNSTAELEEIAQLARGAVTQAALDRALEEHILSAYDTLIRDSMVSRRVAVRSSATAEDLPGASFAGQHQSVLDVADRGALIDAVKQCWASAWTARAIAYRNHRGFDAGRVLLAVIVQEMVRCETAGVLFTENGATGDRNQIVINAANGQAQPVALGEAAADEFVVSRKTGQIESRTAAHDGSGIPCLTDREIQELAALGKRIETLLGSPQDIEWGIHGGEVYILQSRPITSIRQQCQELIERQKRVLRKSEPGTVWSDMLISEVISFPTPMSCELLERFLSRDGSFGIFYERDLRLGSPFSDDILTFICGRPFLNRTAILRPFSFLGFPLKPFDYDLVRGNPAEANSLYPTVDAGVGGSKMIAFVCRALLLFPYTVYALARARLRIEHLASSFHAEFYERVLPAHLQAITDLQRTPLATLQDGELASLVETVMARIARESTMSHIKSEFLAEISSYVVRRLAGERANGLMRGIEGDKHLEASIELWKLSRSATLDMVAGLTGKRVNELRAALASSPEGEAFLARLDAFLERYGHRAHNEFELANPRWREDPGFLITAIKAYLTAEGLDPVEHFEREKAARQAEEEVIGASLSSRRFDKVFGIRKRIFLRALGLLHTYVPLRETTKFYYLMEVEQLRRLLLELGARLAGDEYDCLNNRHDVFFLHSHELSRIVARRASSRAVRRIVMRRKTDYRLRKTIAVPSVVFRDSLDTIGIPRVARTADVLCGTGVCGGTVTGVSRVVMNPSDIGALEAGDILVAPTTDPGWTPLFLVVKGLVMNTGNLLSHGAILAREYGLPTVVNVTDATTKIGTGRRITVDGSLGKVYLH